MSCLLSGGRPFAPLTLSLWLKPSLTLYLLVVYKLQDHSMWMCRSNDSFTSKGQPGSCHPISYWQSCSESNQFILFIAALPGLIFQDHVHGIRLLKRVYWQNDILQHFNLWGLWFEINLGHFASFFFFPVFTGCSPTAPLPFLPLLFLSQCFIGCDCRQRHVKLMQYLSAQIRVR